MKRMTRRKALERWETKVGICEVTPQALWPIAKPFMKRDGPKAPTAIHGPIGVTHQPNEEANVLADCLENQFISHYLCDENHERQVETTVQALFTSASGTPLGKVRMSDIHNIEHSLKLTKTYGLYGIPNNVLGIFQEDHWYI
jgi:hypothetical protein